MSDRSSLPPSSPAPPPDVEDVLRQGLGARDPAALRSLLGLGEEATDRELARALANKAFSTTIARLTGAPLARHDPRTTSSPSADAPTDLASLGSLSGARVALLSEVRTLLALLRGGSLGQRRATVARLGALASGARKLASEEHRAVTEALLGARDAHIEYELAVAREKLSGAPGREAREELERWRKLVGQVSELAVAYWEGQRAEEPIASLGGEERARLLLRTRELPEDLIAHLGAVIEGTDGTSSESARSDLLALLAYCADARLVPSLVSALSSGAVEVALVAARCLAHIDDPRVRPALAAAFERSVRLGERLVLAGALAQVGDLRGHAVVRDALRGDEPSATLLALEALAGFPAFDDIDAVVQLVAHHEPAISIEAVRALRWIGDGRSLAALSRLRDQTGSSAVWAQIEEAEHGIFARLELKGEEPPSRDAASRTHAAVSLANAQSVRDPALVRWRAYSDFVIGNLWLVFGAMDYAAARFESAVARRPRWVVPLVALGLAHARREEFAKALAAFRRAIEVDRQGVERQTLVVRVVTRAFLRRSEEMERIGRREIAQGLLEEALALDLRRADAAQRLELERRHHALRAALGAEGATAREASARLAMAEAGEGV